MLPLLKVDLFDTGAGIHMEGSIDQSCQHVAKRRKMESGDTEWTPKRFQCSSCKHVHKNFQEHVKNKKEPGYAWPKAGGDFGREVLNRANTILSATM